MRVFRYGLWILGFVVVAGIWESASPSLVQLAAQQKSTSPRPKAEAELGLKIKIREGQVSATSVVTRPRILPSPLTPAQTQSLLQRLPPLLNTSEPSLPAFQFPKDQPKPPQPSGSENPAFPVSSKSTAPGPELQFKVERFRPEGAVELAPNLSVTFSEPMVALTSLAELSTQSVPVKLTPQPPGHWRWVGTKTLVFEPEGGRFPMATQYTVTIPAGSASVTGKRLQKSLQWSFSTPPPKLVSSSPDSDSEPLTPLLFAQFNQRMNPATVLEKVQVNAGTHTVPVRLATQTEIEADPDIKAWVDTAQTGACLVLKPVQAFPRDSQVTVTFDAGLTSTEGPLHSTAPQSFSFRTFSPLKIVKTWQEDQETQYQDGWWYELNNPLDEKSFSPDQVIVSPPLKYQDISVRGRRILIDGWKLEQPTYRVTFLPQLKDVFGQSLAGETQFSIQQTNFPSDFQLSGGRLVTIDPAGPPIARAYVRKHSKIRVKLFKVTPDDWPTFARIDATPRKNQDQAALNFPGHLLEDKELSLPADPIHRYEVNIDLRPALTGAVGHAIVELSTQGKNNQVIRSYQWLQVTQIAVEALKDPAHLLITSSQLQNGKPIGNALVTLFPSQTGIRTDHTGVALMELPVPTPEADTVAEYLVVRHGTDSALLQGRFFSGIEKDGWFRKPLKKRLNWFVFDDRSIYRPGEEVHFKGWIRAIESKPGGDITRISTQPTPLTFTVKDSASNTLATGHLTTNQFGGFDGKFRLPDSTALGSASIDFEIALPEAQANADRQTHWHAFRVEEFRRPEFQVSIQPPDPLQIAGSSAELVAQATYFSGNGLSEAEVQWTIHTSETSYKPPNWDQFTFGKWHPWWDVTYPEFQTEQSLQGKTDRMGRHQLHLDFESANPPFPTLVQVEAIVADVNRQQIYNSTQFLVHPATQYVGLNPRRPFSTPGEPFEIETIVTTIDGVAQAARNVQFQVFRIQRSYDFGLWQETEELQGTGQVTTDQTPVIWRFTPPAGGKYVIRGRVVDDQGRPSETEASVWVSREKRHFTDWVDDLEVELIPDKKEYQPGETAHILVNSPFLPAQGVMIVERDGIITYHSIELNESSQVLHVPLEDNFIPAIGVSVYLRGEMVRADEDGTELLQLPKCPISATGWIEIPVSSRSRTLSVTAKPLVDQLAPGSATTINLEVRDHTGKPVPESECVVAVVDEAILALFNGEIEDPARVMYRDQLFGSNFQTLRDSIRRASESELTADITRLLQVRPVADRFLPITSYALRRQSRDTTEESSIKNREAGPQFDLAQDNIATLNPSEQSIPLRSNFDPLAVFAPSVVTDADGKAVVTVTMPDNLTRYRVIALATDGEKRFGKGESTMTTWLPLMVRPSAPRFLNFGDEFELPVTVHNQTDQAQHVNMAIQSGQMNFPQGAGRMVLVPAQDRVEVRFPAIPQTTGTVFFQIVASSDLASDAASGSFPVQPPTMTEAFATYGELQAGTLQLSLTIPTDARLEFSQFEMTASATQLQTLTDAVWYLMDYPYGCAEQIASRILAITALQDVLTELRAPGRPDPEAYQTQVAADLDQLEKVHNRHGGFGFWSRSEKPLPFLSIHVAHALIRARQKGYTVPHFLLGRSKDYLSKIKDHIPKEYSPESRQTLLAYALYVRHLTGESDAETARDLVKETGAEKLPIEAIGWLLPVLAKNPATKSEQNTLFRVLTNRVTETAGAASFVESYSDGAEVLLHSNRRTDAVILDALLSVQPDSDLIPKLVRGLLAHRVNGRWSNTQENAFVLLALERYFSTFEHHTPDFLARVWLGDTFAGAHRFAGRTTDQHQLGIPLNQVGTPGETKSITLSKDGTGRMYYRLGLSYAPKETRLSPVEAGFTVSREYNAVDNPADVKRLSATEWQIRAGARVKVTVTMVTPTRRAHVALSCPLPAGLEILNPALATTPRLPDDEESPRLNWWQRSWFDHQNLRDNQAEAFTASLSEGVYTYSFFAVATTPGKFLVPPARAEEMYAPETFGRSATDLIVVRD